MCAGIHSEGTPAAHRKPLIASHFAPTFDPMSANVRLRVTRQRRIALSTLILGLVCAAVFLSSLVGLAAGLLPWWLTLALNTGALYASYIVMHDAAHGAVFPTRSGNEWLGRLCTFIINPLFSFPAYRFIHMQHHRFTNERVRDPDMYVAGGNPVSTGLRCLTSDIAYAVYYLRSWNERPRSEQVETVIAAFAGLGALVAVGVLFGPKALVFGWLLPSRLATGLLAFLLAWLPHWPHAVEQRNDLYRASAVRLGWESVMTPLLLFQNFHLVHHVVPSAPFYDARSIWYDNLEFFMSQDPTVKTFPTTKPPPPTVGVPQDKVAPPPRVPRELQ